MAIRSLYDATAGPDKIHNLMLMRSPSLTLTKLLKTFGPSFPKGVPLGHCDSDSDCRERMSDYRPISLTSNVSKLFERLICRRSCYSLERARLGNPVCSGICKGRSTTDHPVTLYSSVRENFICHHLVGAIFFDIEGTYTASRHGLLLELHDYGIRI